MLPKIEVYVNVENDWVTASLAERFREALQSLLPELLAVPQGPDHVLSQLNVFPRSRKRLSVSSSLSLSR